MASYTIETKESFTILGYGVELKSDYTDFVGLNNEKLSYLTKIKNNGTMDKLKEVALNNELFIVNEAINNKKMYYVGVLAKDFLLDNAHLIQFPKGEYLVVKGSGSTTEELSTNLTGITFGEILGELKEYAYVGGPNASVEMKEEDGLLKGEMWVPLAKL